MTAPAEVKANLTDPEVLRARLVETAEGITRSIETFREQHARDVAAGRHGDAVWAPTAEEMKDNSGRPVLLDAYARLASALAAIAELDMVVLGVNPPAAGWPTPSAAGVDEARRALDAIEPEREARQAVERDAAVLEAIRAALARHGYVTGSDLVQAVERVLFTAKQYREAFSHSSQIQAHYLGALAAFVRAVRVNSVDVYGIFEARRIALHALDHPPAWDGRLR